MATIQKISTPLDIARCHPVLVQLRPNIDCEALVAQVQEQFLTQHYHLVAALVDDVPVAVAGYRFSLSLYAGRFLYVDDLVTDEIHRGGGYGANLLDWLAVEAKHAGCGELHLDSGVQRFSAHRFYLTKRMDIKSHHFSMKL